MLIRSRTLASLVQLVPLLLALLLSSGPKASAAQDVRSPPLDESTLFIWSSYTSPYVGRTVRQELIDKVGLIPAILTVYYAAYAVPVRLEIDPSDPRILSIKNSVRFSIDYMLPVSAGALIERPQLLATFDPRKNGGYSDLYIFDFKSSSFIPIKVYLQNTLGYTRMQAIKAQCDRLLNSWVYRKE